MLGGDAKGLTTGELFAALRPGGTSRLRGRCTAASISKDTVSRITDKVVEETQAWCSRPLQGVYAAICIDAIYVKVRDGSPQHFVH